VRDQYGIVSVLLRFHEKDVREAEEEAGGTEK
jgi:hypothetical protein